MSISLFHKVIAGIFVSSLLSFLISIGFFIYYFDLFIIEYINPNCSYYIDGSQSEEDTAISTQCFKNKFLMNIILITIMGLGILSYLILCCSCMSY